MIGTGSRTTSIIITAISILSMMMVLLFSSSPLSGAPLIFAQTEETTTATSSSNSSNIGGVGCSRSDNNTMGMIMTSLNLGAPLYIEHGGPINTTNITPNVYNATIEGNGTFMLPTGENVSVIGSGYRLVNTTDGLVKVNGQSLLKTTDGKESALFDIAQFRTINSTKGIGTAYLQTNSITIPTEQQQQQLASLNNTIGVYDSEAISSTEFKVTWWQLK